MKKFASIMLYTILIGAVSCAILSCSGGGSSDDDYYSPGVPTSPEQPSTPQNNGQVKVICPECSGKKTCSTCNGSGKWCRSCKGEGYCTSCKGTGNCYKCDGDGKCNYCENGKVTCTSCNGLKSCRTCYGTGKIESFNGSITCPNCRGTKKCNTCSGTGLKKCYYCLGNGKCDNCYGKGNCDVCYGKGTCSVCGGDGHCTACNNSDGKCSKCRGEGYIYYDYVLSPVSLDFTHDGEEKSVSITTNKSWKVTCNTNWITISNPEGKGNGSFTVKAEPNYDYSERSATLYINCEGKSGSYTVSQDAADNTQDKMYSDIIIKLLKSPMMLEGIDISKPLYHDLCNKLSLKYVYESGCYGDPDYFGWLSLQASDNPSININYRNMNFDFMYLSENTNGSYSYTNFYYGFPIEVSKLPDPLVMARLIERDFNNAFIPIKLNDNENSAFYNYYPYNYTFDDYDFVNTYYPSFTYDLELTFGLEWRKFDDDKYWLFYIHGNYKRYNY